MRLVRSPSSSHRSLVSLDLAGHDRTTTIRCDTRMLDSRRPPHRACLAPFRTDRTRSVAAGCHRVLDRPPPRLTTPTRRCDARRQSARRATVSSSPVSAACARSRRCATSAPSRTQSSQPVGRYRASPPGWGEARRRYRPAHRCRFRPVRIALCVEQEPDAVGQKIRIGLAVLPRLQRQNRRDRASGRRNPHQAARNAGREHDHVVRVPRPTGTIVGRREGLRNAAAEIEALQRAFGEEADRAVARGPKRQRRSLGAR